MIVNAALQEDVQVIGLSILSGRAQRHRAARDGIAAREGNDRREVVIVGGIIPDEDAEALKQSGVAAVFQPGASLDAIVEFIRGRVGGSTEPYESAS